MRHGVYLMLPLSRGSGRACESTTDISQAERLKPATPGALFVTKEGPHSGKTFTKLPVLG